MRLLAQELYQFNTNKNSLSQGEMKALLTLFPVGQPYRLSSVGVNQTGSPITLPNSGETPTISYSGTAEELINNVD